MSSAKHCFFNRANVGMAVSRINFSYSAGFILALVNCHWLLNSVRSLTYSNTSATSKSVTTLEPMNGGVGRFGACGRVTDRTVLAEVRKPSPAKASRWPLPLVETFAAARSIASACRAALAPSCAKRIDGETLARRLSAASLSMTRRPSKASSP